MTLTAAADGSALGNPGPAGWAWYIDDSTWRAGGWPHGTNNMGELQAVLDLLESTAGLGEPLHVLCDSQYVINAVTRWMKGWKKKGWRKADGRPVLNVELMKALDAALEGREVTFEWVKGHAGHALNEAADARANAAARAMQAGRAVEEGPGLTSLGGPGAAGDRGDDDARPAPGSSSGREPEELGDPDPDLLSVLAEQAEELAAGRSPGQQVLELERRRLAHGLPGAAVHPQAVLVGEDGRLAAAEALGGGDASVDVHVLGLVELSRNAVQVTVQALAQGGCAVHSTLWVREDSRNELGQWLLRHHQITRES